MQRMNITIPEELYVEFRDRCKVAGVGMSTVIQDIIRSALERPFKAKLPPADRKIQTALNAEAIRVRDAEIIRRAAKERQADLAREFGMTNSGISRVLARARKRGKSGEIGKSEPCPTPSPQPLT